MITRFEDFLETRLEGLFKRAFPRSLEPGDLARALYKQMLQQRLKSVKYTYVPNYYLLRLHPRDYQAFVPYQQSLLGELAEYLQGKARERQLHLLQPPEIQLDFDEEVPQGQTRVFGRLQEETEQKASEDTLIYDEDRVNQKKEPDSGRWLVEVTEGVDKGKSFPLTKFRNLIGRQLKAEISLLDPSVSRYHAQLELLSHQVLLTDLGSTNGTIYEEKSLDTVLLNSGDRFRVGNTALSLWEKHL